MSKKYVGRDCTGHAADSSRSRPFETRAERPYVSTGGTEAEAMFEAVSAGSPKGLFDIPGPVRFGLVGH
jgi:hypothetical protein